MPSILARRIYRRVVIEDGLNMTRFLLGAAEFLWAVLLAWPGKTFDRPTYHVMSHVMPENMWAFVFLLMSACQISIIGMYRIDRRTSVTFSFCNMCFLWFVVLSMYFSVSAPAAISGETALAIGASIIFIRSGWGGLYAD